MDGKNAPRVEIRDLVTGKIDFFDVDRGSCEKWVGLLWGFLSPGIYIVTKECKLEEVEGVEASCSVAYRDLPSGFTLMYITTKGGKTLWQVLAGGS